MPAKLPDGVAADLVPHGNPQTSSDAAFGSEFVKSGSTGQDTPARNDIGERLNEAQARQEIRLPHEPDTDFRAIATEGDEGASKFALSDGLIGAEEADGGESVGLYNNSAAANTKASSEQAAPPNVSRNMSGKKHIIDVTRLESGRAIHAVVWSLAWPSVMTMLLQTFNGLMDTLFVGHLPNARLALAATGIGGQVVFLLISLAMGVSVGTTALVARFTGADNHEDRLWATAQSLMLSLGLAVVFGTLFYFGRFWIIGKMLTGSDGPQAGLLCGQFLGMALLAVLPMFLQNVLMGAFRGLGDTRTPMLIQIAAIATHISFNWLLIYGHWGFPRLGVRGAGIAFALSVWVSAVLYFAALYWRSPLRMALTRSYLTFDPTFAWYGRILRIGLPASIQAVLRSLAMMSFTSILARTLEGSTAVAALSIGVRAEALAYMPGFGYSVAASALVGQCLGAKDPRRAERSAWAATHQAMLVMAFVGVCFYLFSGTLAGIFTDDTSVRDLAAAYLIINSVCEPFMAMGMVLTGALQGAGDTIRPTVITFFTMWMVRIPLAVWLMFNRNMQSRGAWWSMCITAIIGGLLTTALFQSGRWKKIKV